MSVPGILRLADGLLPTGVAVEVLRRWQEPHRRYHDIRHLAFGLDVLDDLGAGPLERIAFWFHDAVYRGNSPADEMASAALARELLAGHRDEGDTSEVARLVLITIEHRARPGDEAGARVCDADLSGLGGSWRDYRANLDGIRAELPGLDPGQWRHRRRRFVRSLLAREAIFLTPRGRWRWEASARANLVRELGMLGGDLPDPRGRDA